MFQSRTGIPSYQQLAVRAALALGTLGGDALPLLAELARTAPSNQARTEAAQALVELRQPELAPRALAELARTATDEHARAKAVAALGQLADIGGIRHTWGVAPAGGTPTTASGVAVALVATDAVTTSVLLVVIFGVVRSGRTGAVLAPGGAWVAAAVCFTPSASFANPAVTVARALTDIYSGRVPRASRCSSPRNWTAPPLRRSPWGCCREPYRTVMHHMLPARAHACVHCRPRRRDDIPCRHEARGLFSHVCLDAKAAIVSGI